MANRYSVASGLASAVGTWDGGASVPVSGDRVLISTGTTVTLDGAYEWGDDTGSTITINGVSTTRSITVIGTLAHSRSVNSSLTGYGTISVRSGATYDAGTVASPIPLGVTATVYVNRSAAMVTGKYLFECLAGSRPTFHGVARKRWTTLTATANVSDTSVAVADATGWQAGDLIQIASDNHGTTTNGYEFFTIQAGYVSGALTIPFSAGSVVRSHRSGLPVSNLTNNVRITPYATATPGNFFSQISNAETANTRLFKYVTFDSLQGTFPNNSGPAFTQVDQYSNVPFVNPYSEIAGCVFTTSVSNVTYILDTQQGANPIYATSPTITNSVMTPSYAVAVNTSPASGIGSLWTFDGCLLSGNILNCAAGYGATVKNSWLVGSNSSSSQLSALGGHGNAVIFDTCKFSGSAGALVTTASNFARHKFNTCDIGGTYPLTTTTAFSLSVGPYLAECTFTDCTVSPAIVTAAQQPVLQSSAYINVVNRDANVTKQDQYFKTHTAARSNTEYNRGRSSVSMKPVTLLSDAVRTQAILCANGASIRVVGYVKADTAFYNGGGASWTAPTVTISGLGITPATFTASSAANNAWEKFDLTATNSSGNDGNLVLSYTVNPKLVTTGTVYFDGVPEAPFITKVRHYGFAFDEASPTRTVNAAVHASEATAATYGGVTVTWGTSVSPVALTANQTLQTLYDYTQYQSVLPANSANAVPMTGVGVAGSPSLFAQGNVTTTGYTLNGGGSLSMGAYTLTGSIPWAYTYMGGTFSQAAAVPSFSGGTLALGDGGTYTFTMAGSTLVTVNPSGSASYTLSAGSFTGTLTVNNLTATPVTVYIPAGVTTSSTGNTGGAITFSAPIVQQSVTITNVVAGSRVQIYDTTNSLELFNGTSGYSWTDPSPAAAPRNIRVRIAYVNGTSAKAFVEANIGTCGTTAPTNAVTYLASQADDPVYNSNAVDGSTVTGITIVEGATDRVQINVAGGTVPWRDIYAYQCYWLFDATGIQDDGAFISAPDTANYTLTGFKIKNTHASVPLVITDGYGVDSTGSVTVLYDTTGTSIFPAPEHVVAKVVSVGGANIITGDIADIPAAVLAAAVAAPIHSNIMKVNAVTVTGNGQPGTEWGP